MPTGHARYTALTASSALAGVPVRSTPAEACRAQRCTKRSAAAPCRTNAIMVEPSTFKGSNGELPACCLPIMCSNAEMPARAPLQRPCPASRTIAVAGLLSCITPDPCLSGACCTFQSLPASYQGCAACACVLTVACMCACRRPHLQGAAAVGRRGVALQQRHHRLAPAHPARALAGVASRSLMCA